MPVSAERKTPIVGTTIELVAYPNEFSLMWDPSANSGKVAFKWIEFLEVDGAMAGRDAGREGYTVRQWSAVKNISPAYPGEVDPNTGADLTQISMAGVLKILLSAFDRAYVQDVTP